MSRPFRRVLPALTLLAFVVSDRPAVAGAAPTPLAGTLAARRRAAETAGPRIVLATPEGAERQVAVRDLAFVFFKRTFFTKRAPRSEDASGQAALDRQDSTVEVPVAQDS